MYRRYFKRIIDVQLVLLLIIFSVPVQLLVAILLSLFQGDVFFVQRRPGYKGRLFKVFKFKTMRDGEVGNSNQPDEIRITRLGRFLRRTNLDELPQLFNVLMGSMSLVGPRPFLETYLPLYNSTQLKRHEVKPGLTGLAQINGGNNISWEEKINYDLEYVKNISLALDLRILMTTFFKLATFKGFDTGSFIPETFKGDSKIQVEYTSAEV